MKKQVLILGLVLSFNAYGANDCVDGEQNCWDCGRSDSDLCTARLNGEFLITVGRKDYRKECSQINKVYWCKSII